MLDKVFLAKISDISQDHHLMLITGDVDVPGSVPWFIVRLAPTNIPNGQRFEGCFAYDGNRWYMAFPTQVVRPDGHLSGLPTSLISPRGTHIFINQSKHIHPDEEATERIVRKCNQLIIRFIENAVSATAK